MPLKPRFEIVIAEYTIKCGKKIKKKEIAEKVEITQQYLSEIIAGRTKNVDTETLFKLARVLDCRVDDLYELIEEE